MAAWGSATRALFYTTTLKQLPQHNTIQHNARQVEQNIAYNVDKDNKNKNTLHAHVFTTTFKQLPQNNTT